MTKDILVALGVSIAFQLGDVHSASACGKAQGDESKSRLPSQTQATRSPEKALPQPELSLESDEEIVVVPQLTAPSTGGFRNKQTLGLDPVEEIPEAMLFISEDGHAFDITELSRSIRSSESFTNPYTREPFTQMDQARILTHPSTLGRGLGQYKGPRAKWRPLRPELLGVMQYYVNNSLGSAGLTRKWILKYVDNPKEIFDLPVLLRNSAGTVEFDGTFGQLIDGASSGSFQKWKLDTSHLQKCLNGFFRVSIEAAAAGTFLDTQAEKYDKSKTWEYLGIQDRSQDGYFTSQSWKALYDAYVNPRHFGGGGGTIGGGVGK